MNIRNTLIGLLALAIGNVAVAGKKEVTLNPQHPQQYVVTAGDTLWDVAEKFLKDPWQWPDLWGDDAKTAHPLRPGDVLTLTEESGKPRLLLNSTSGFVRRPGDPLPVVKLSPSVRATPLIEEIPLIPLNAVRAFLSSPKVVMENELENVPRIVELIDGRKFAGTLDKVYVKGFNDDMQQPVYGLFRKASTAYRDIESGDELGFEAVHVGDVSFTQEGDPAIFTLTRALQEARVDDFLMPLDEERIPAHYEPHAPEFELKGHIIGVLGDAPHIGRLSVVVLDKGTNDGVDTGHVLNLYRKNRAVSARVSGKSYDENPMPAEVIGSVLVFRPFERVSFALVMKATREFIVGDAVQNP